MISYWLYLIGEFIAVKLPLAMGYKFAEVISDMRSIFALHDKKAVLANLVVIFPNKPVRELRQIRKRMFRNFAKYLVDFFRFSLMDDKYIRRYATVEGRQYVDEASVRGKGVILLSAHIGNWEMGGVVMANLGHKISAVALSHKNDKVNRFFIAHREQRGVMVIPFEHAARCSLALLKDNGMLALIGDRDFTKKGGLAVDFFGKPSLMPKGPAALALKTGACIVPGFMIRNSDDTFTLKFEQPIYPACTGNEEEDIVCGIAKYIKVIESYIKQYPDQWFMFRQFWI